MPRYTRVARQEFPSTSSERVGKIDVAYVYMDERFQTVMIQVPREEDTPERIREELRKAATAAAGGGEELVEV